MTTVNAHSYLRQVQRLLREQRQEFSNPEDLLSYINLARREVAGRTQCVRRLTPISGQIVDAKIVTAGSGYVTPIATITTPDFPSGAKPNALGKQATATATATGGVITDITINDGGDGYFEPLITITDATGPGTGATVTPVLSTLLNLLNPGQEVYNFTDIDLGGWPGVDSVYAIKSVSIVYSNYRYSVPVYAFSTYQAMIRNYALNYQYVPAFGSQFGQGTNGSFYLYPPPSQVYQFEYDCFCLPQDMLLDNSIPEVIPMPWCDAVQYMAVQLGFQELQNFNAAKFYEQQFDKRTLGYSSNARIGRAVNQYGRY
jgi:hypothetical protein